VAFVGIAEETVLVLEFLMSNRDEQNPWVIRISFSNPQVWTRIKTLVAAPQLDTVSGMEFSANVRFIEQPAFADLSCHDIVRSLPAEYPGFVVFVVDEQTIEHQEHPLAVIGFAPQGDKSADFARKPSQTPDQDIKYFRATPSAIQSIENNLSIANMDFEDFVNAVGKDGVFRGFGS
jgi:hypothetical protein